MNNPSEHSGISRRDLLTGGALTLGGVWFGSHISNHSRPGEIITPPTTVEHEKPLASALLKRREEIVVETRSILEFILSLQKRDLTPAQKKRIISHLLKQYFGCVDDRLLLPNEHKVAVAGTGAGQREDELNEYVEVAKHDPIFVKRLRGSVAHRNCAAHNKDDAKAESAARNLANRFGLPPGSVHMASYLPTDEYRMLGNKPEDQHIHQGQVSIWDATGNNFVAADLLQIAPQKIYPGHDILPVFKISLQHMPIEYAKHQMAIVRDIYEGPEGMDAVAEYPHIIIIAGNTAQDIDTVLKDFGQKIDRFHRPPEVVPLICT